MQKSLEKNETIRNFLESDEPSHSQIVNAYYERDIIMGLDKEKVFDSAVKKLGLNPDDYDKMIDNRFKRKMLECVDNFLKNKSLPMEQIDYENFRDNLLKGVFNNKLIRYNELMKHKNQLKDFYNSLSNEELQYLGW